jgi:hypothetical protein
MAANTIPVFTLTPVLGAVQISTANANRDGNGTLGTVVTGGAYGTRISRITIKAQVTTTAGMVRLFIEDSMGSKFLWKEILVTAITASATVAAFESIIDLTDDYALVLPVNYILKASTEKAELFSITVNGGSY